jgi:hypothetical protein
MISENYKLSILVPANIDRAYQSLVNHIPDWWTKTFEGSANKIDDEFTVRFDATFKKMKVEDLIPGEKVSWICLDSFIDVPEIQHKTEWIGTRIEWHFESLSDHTSISLVHYGLNDKMDCFEICTEGWVNFTESLRLYLTTRHGLPFTSVLIPLADL